MNSNRSKLQHEQRQESEHQAESNQQQAPKEFESVEALLRFDQEQISPPASIERRLQDSVSAIPVKRPWWKRWLGRL